MPELAKLAGPPALRTCDLDARGSLTEGGHATLHGDFGAERPGVGGELFGKGLDAALGQARAAQREHANQQPNEGVGGLEAPVSDDAGKERLEHRGSQRAGQSGTIPRLMHRQIAAGGGLALDVAKEDLADTSSRFAAPASCTVTSAASKRNLEVWEHTLSPMSARRRRSSR